MRKALVHCGNSEYVKMSEAQGLVATGDMKRNRKQQLRARAFTFMYWHRVSCGAEGRVLSLLWPEDKEVASRRCPLCAAGHARSGSHVHGSDRGSWGYWWLDMNYDRRHVLCKPKHVCIREVLHDDTESHSLEWLYMVCKHDDRNSYEFMYGSLLAEENPSTVKASGSWLQLIPFHLHIRKSISCTTPHNTTPPKHSKWDTTPSL